MVSCGIILGGGALSSQESYLEGHMDTYLGWQSPTATRHRTICRDGTSVKTRHYHTGWTLNSYPKQGGWPIRRSVKSLPPRREPCPQPRFLSSWRKGISKQTVVLFLPDHQFPSHRVCEQAWQDTRATSKPTRNQLTPVSGSGDLEQVMNLSCRDTNVMQKEHAGGIVHTVRDQQSPFTKSTTSGLWILLLWSGVWSMMTYKSLFTSGRQAEVAFSSHHL